MQLSHVKIVLNRRPACASKPGFESLLYESAQGDGAGGWIAIQSVDVNGAEPSPDGQERIDVFRAKTYVAMIGDLIRKNARPWPSKALRAPAPRRLPLRRAVRPSERVDMGVKGDDARRDLGAKTRAVEHAVVADAGL